MFRLDTTLGRLRFTGLLEGISFILLIGIAMPLKYIWGQPQAVSVIGMAHGVLWIAYVGLAIMGQDAYKWPLKTTALLVLASLLPFGPFVADAKLLSKVEDNEE